MLSAPTLITSNLVHITNVSLAQQKTQCGRWGMGGRRWRRVVEQDGEGHKNEEKCIETSVVNLLQNSAFGLGLG